MGTCCKKEGTKLARLAHPTCGTEPCNYITLFKELVHPKILSSFTSLLSCRKMIGFISPAKHRRYFKECCRGGRYDQNLI